MVCGHVGLVGFVGLWASEMMGLVDLWDLWTDGTCELVDFEHVDLWTF